LFFAEANCVSRTAQIGAASLNGRRNNRIGDGLVSQSPQRRPESVANSARRFVSTVVTLQRDGLNASSNLRHFGRCDGRAQYRI